MQAKTVALYNCKQRELYTICKMGWRSCLAFLTFFAAFSGLYTAAFIAGKQAAILAAEALPDYYARNGMTTSLNADLKKENKKIGKKFQWLKQYIASAFPEHKWQLHWDAAGFIYFTPSSKDDWDSTVAMLISMINFVTINNIRLQANFNMPASFLTDLITLQTSFTTKHLHYLRTRQIEELEAENKIKANNAIYNDLISMFTVGKLLGFSFVIQKQFTFASLLRYVRGTGISGIKGFILSAATNQGIENAEISIPELGITVLSNSDGSFQLIGIKSGSYTIQITAPNPTIGPPYQPQSQPITVLNGTVSTCNFSMLQ